MSITDELREWAHGFNGPWKRNEEMLLAIADRIDEEHKRLMREDYDRNMDASGYVRLPVDAEGVPIRVGDRIEYNTGGRDTVRFLAINCDGWTVNERGWKGETMHHVQPDSWERIIRDAQGDGILNQIDGRPSDFFALVERCKRLAGEEE